MGVDLVTRLIFGADVRATSGKGGSFLDRILAGEFGDYAPHDPAQPWYGIEEHMLDRLPLLSVLEAVDLYDGSCTGAVVGVTLAQCDSRGEFLSEGLTQQELAARMVDARRTLARHDISGGRLWLTSYAG